MDRLPLIAHRGYPAHYPENTLVGLEAALKAGADFLEFDVQLSADRVPLLLHDENLKRTTGFKGRVTDTPFAQIKTLCAGEISRFGRKFIDESIPSLRDATELMRLWPDATPFVEIKSNSIHRFGVEQTVDQILETLQPIHRKCVLISFHLGSLIRARSQGPWRIGWIVDTWHPGLLKKIEPLAPDYVFINYKRFPDSISHLPKGSWHWALYEISDPRIALAWLARGANLIATDAIGEMLQQLLMHHKD